MQKIYKKLAEELSSLGYTEDELVFGNGDENSPVMLIGEAPGKDEVIKKRPFSGKAGKNLDEFLMATGIEREKLFITNTVKFRPYKIGVSGRKSNRPPTAEEIRICAGCLREEIGHISPKLIVTLGNTALKAASGDKDIVISAVHGTLIEKEGLPRIYAMYHPASIIYRRELAETYREDMEKLSVIMKEIL